MISPQVGIRLDPEALDKLKDLAHKSGLPLGTLCRQILQDFAEIAPELGATIEAARRGGSAEALADWAADIVRKSGEEADELREQLRMPVR